MNKLILLTNYYKKIGMVLIIIAIAIPIVMLQFKTSSYLYLFKSATKILIIVAGLFLIFSKEKTEDEMTYILRLRAISFAFITGVSFYLVDESHLLDYFETSPASTFKFIASVEFWYLIYFYLLKPMNLRKKDSKHY